MAQAPMQQDMSGGDQDASQDQSGQDDDFSSGYCIEIRVMPDKSMSVHVESIADEEQEEGGADDDNYQPVSGTPELFKLIKQIIAAGGNMGQAGADQDDMNAGYGAASPSGSM